MAFDRHGTPITADDIGAAGAATVLMREALKPNLMQTIENTPVLIHAGPFGNIAHGNASILADQIALRGAEYVVTESGFGMDLGGEKFFDIKCRTAHTWPAAAVMVATIRALTTHTGKYTITSGKPLPPALLAQNPDDVYAGGANLRKQIENVKRFGVPVVVALNAFPEDTPAEIEAVRQLALEAGAHDMAVSTVFADGGRGGIELAQKVITAVEAPVVPSRYLYPNDASIKNKIGVLATGIYGAADVSYSATADKQIAMFERNV